MDSETRAVFEGATGSLRLGVEGYEFPDLADDEWSANWLVIVGDAELNGRRWRFRDPCLTTSEIQYLADWLDQLIAGGAERYCGFLEPNLNFERKSERLIRITFSLEARPPWDDPVEDAAEIGFDVPVDGRLATAARSLRELLSQYPVRARG